MLEGAGEGAAPGQQVGQQSPGNGANRGVFRRETAVTLGAREGAGGGVAGAAGATGGAAATAGQVAGPARCSRASRYSPAMLAAVRPDTVPQAPRAPGTRQRLFGPAFADDCDPTFFICPPPYCWGDPHCRTEDGVFYDFQGAGEFILIRDPDGMEIQTIERTPVWHGCCCSCC